MKEKCKCDSESCKCMHKSGMHHGAHGGGEAVYGLGLIGALIYFIQNASGFWVGVVGVLEAIVWPVIVVYKLLESLL